MAAAMTNQSQATSRSRVDGRPAQRPELPGRWHALTVGLAAAFMTLLDVSIVNVALPSIERDLGASAASAQWVVSGYALAFGLALVPAGRLGDRLGRRRMFLIALSAFVATSALSGAAPTSGLLVTARLLPAGPPGRRPRGAAGPGRGVAAGRRRAQPAAAPGGRRRRRPGPAVAAVRPGRGAGGRLCVVGDQDGGPGGQPLLDPS
jgi:MFS family permease